MRDSWIPVDDQLPAIEEDCLLNNFVIARRIENRLIERGWEWEITVNQPDLGSSYCLYLTMTDEMDVTHWLAIPKLTEAK